MSNYIPADLAARGPMVYRLPVPPSTNNLFINVPRVGRVKSRAYTAWVVAADKMLLAQKRAHDLPNQSYGLFIRFPKMRGDIDNRIKPISDYLVSRGLTPDDKYMESVAATRTQQRGDTCEVHVLPPSALVNETLYGGAA